MRGGQTPGLMRTGRSCTREAGRGSGQNPWTLSGKRSTRSGPKGPARGFLSGSERGLARRLVMLILPKARKTEARHPLSRKRKKRRKRKRRRRTGGGVNQILASKKQHATSALQNIPDSVMLSNSSLEQSSRMFLINSQHLSGFFLLFEKLNGCAFSILLYWILSFSF